MLEVSAALVTRTCRKGDHSVGYKALQMRWASTAGSCAPGQKQPHEALSMQSPSSLGLLMHRLTLSSPCPSQKPFCHSAQCSATFLLDTRCSPEAHALRPCAEIPRPLGLESLEDGSLRPGPRTQASAQEEGCA
jgi:hypothetical protein